VNPDLDSLDSWVLSEVTSLLFVYVCDTDVTSGFVSASEVFDILALYKSDYYYYYYYSLIRIRIRSLNGWIHLI